MKFVPDLPINSLEYALSLIPEGHRVRNLAPNTQLVKTENTVELVLYGQPIAVWSPVGFHLVKPEYFPNNKLSHTTVKRLNDYCPAGMSVSSTKNGTFLHHGGMKFVCFSK